MPIWVERPPGDPAGGLSASRNRTFNADRWERTDAGSLELWNGEALVAEIVTGDWTLAEQVPGS